MKVVPNVRKRRLEAFINRHVADDAEAIYTDEMRLYQGLGDEDTRHETVNHSKWEYVQGDVHTNSIENVWSLLKNGIRGVYHSVGHDYLQTYVDEYAFRYNHKDDSTPMFKTILGLTPQHVA